MSTPPPATPAKGDKTSSFTEKDMRLLAAAMMSLKTGLPELDYTKFQVNGEFNTMKTAQNTWGVLKKKIMALNPEAAEAAAATPKAKATPKKRTKKEADGEDGAEAEANDDEEASAKKKPKTPRKKKADVAEADGEEAAGDGSPAPAKKAPKTPRKKATPKKKSEETVEEATKSDEGEASDEVKKEVAEPKTPEAAPAAEDTKMEGDE